jgi:DNA modification methylase
MVAFALRADGWYLRSDIIWNKPNPMPESITDRPTKSHEYIFLLAKEQKYYYDADAIKEDFADKRMGNRGLYKCGMEGHKDQTLRNDIDRIGKGWNIDGMIKSRNKRSVWTVTTKPYKEAHFATYPPDLIEPCILAGSKEGDIVLDPFAGSGTTLMVAIKHKREAIGIELNPDYETLIRKRVITDVQLI